MDPIEQRSDRRQRWIAASRAAVFAAMSDAGRIARWWGPAGFSNTIHCFEFVAGGRWLLTMHGPDGAAWPNESRFTRIEQDSLLEVEHLSGHHFILTIALHEKDGGTEVSWQQCFDSAAHYQQLAGFLATANAQNLDRLAAEVARGSGGA